jgi:ketosteroid isomerase-like protein
MIETKLSPVERFVDAIANRDFEALDEILAPNVEFRALIPPGVREAKSPLEARGYIEGWFGDADEFEMVRSSIDTVGDRIHATYRLHVREDGERYVCEQHVFADLGRAGIEKLDVMCSGFCPLGR